MAESTPFLESNFETDDSEKYENRSNEMLQESRSVFFRNWKDIALLVSTTSTLLLVFILFRRTVLPKETNITRNSSLLSPEIDTEHWVPNHWVSDYSSADVSGMDQVDKNWNNIRAAHGIVAVDHQWAAEKGLPPSVSLPSDANKGVYTIDSYHSLHCLIVIRRTMFQLAKRQPLDVPFGHSTHCIDAVRQSIMCNAADTLLYKRHNVSDGDGQMRKCRNWGALRDWASKHSACYADSHQAIAGEEREGCELRTSLGDGVIVRDWPE